ncbi:MAG: KTSC domain-containing protein [Bacillota bacterium]|nr:KTSC domain-containing protein [Bacillota bacterium]
MLKKSILMILIIMLAVCGCSAPTGQNYDVSTTVDDTSEQLQAIEQAEQSFKAVSNDNQQDDQQAEALKWVPNFVTVKYRDTSVDIAAPYFEYHDTTGSSFIRGAWYDQNNQYMVINLDGVYYHYCAMPYSVWMNFKRADSYGRFYNQYIKGQYDCRQGYVPVY